MTTRLLRCGGSFALRTLAALAGCDRPRRRTREIEPVDIDAAAARDTARAGTGGSRASDAAPGGTNGGEQTGGSGGVAVDAGDAPDLAEDASAVDAAADAARDMAAPPIARSAPRPPPSCRCPGASRWPGKD
jgi:hypothetical protein